MESDAYQFYLASNYDEDYFERGPQTGKSLYENYHWMEEPTIRMAQSIINVLGLTSQHKVLDYGCAKGFLVRALRILGIDAYGCDTSQYAIAHLDPAVVDVCRPIDPHTLAIPFEEKFDWVITKDVLEHMTISQLKTFLANSRKQCKQALHIVPLADNTFHYIVPEYEQDKTHLIRQTRQWWSNFFNDHYWQNTAFSYTMPDIKENWTGRYPEGNGFFTMKMRRPRFSMIMPTKNRQAFIHDAICGLLWQRFQDWELVIKDAGESVRDLLPPDPRIKYTHMPNAYYVEQVDSAFADAEGEIFNFCADDDVMQLGTLETVDTFIGDAMWAYGKIIRDDGIQWYGEPWNYMRCEQMNIVPCPAAFWKREVVDEVGIPDVSVECWDWDYWLKLGLRWPPVFINRALSYYRCHPQMGSATKVEAIIAGEQQVRERVRTKFYRMNVLKGK